MNRHIKNYLDSFRMKRQFWQIFLVDLVFFGLAALAFTWFGSYLQAKSLALMGGKTPEQIQGILASASPEQVLPFLTQLKSFLLISIGGFLLLIVLAFLFYSLSRAVVWNHLLGKKLTRETYWKWNALNLALIIPVLLYGVFYLIVKLIAGGIIKFLMTINPAFYVQHTTIMDALLTIANGAVSFILTLFLLIIVFFIYCQFTEKYKVWLSIGESFHLIKKYWPRLWRALLLMVLTALILTGVLWPVRKLLIYRPLWTMAVNLAVSLLFLAWMRIYLLRTVGHKF